MEAWSPSIWRRRTPPYGGMEPLNPYGLKISHRVSRCSESVLTPKVAQSSITPLTAYSQKYKVVGSLYCYHTLCIRTIERPDKVRGQLSIGQGWGSGY